MEFTTSSTSRMQKLLRHHALSGPSSQKEKHKEVSETDKMIPADAHLGLGDLSL